MNAFFLALVDPAVLETSLLFFSFVGDDMVPPSPLFFFFLLLLPHLVHFIFSIALIWQV